LSTSPALPESKNPVLRRTVGKIATLEKVAQIGGMDVGKLVNTLRRAVGQAELGAEATANFAIEIPRLIDAPAWIAGEPQFTLNGTEMLQRGEVPLERVNELLGQIEPGRFILLVTNFEPTPIIEAMQKQKQNHRVFHKVHPEDTQRWLTFIQ
jgi:hypothetical protein